MLFLLSFYFKGFFIQLSVHFSHVLGEVLHVFSVLLNNVYVASIMMKPQIIQKFKLFLFDVCKLNTDFLMVFLKRLMIVQKLVINLLELFVFLFKLVELLFIKEIVILQFHLTLSVVLTNEFMPFYNLANKLHEKIFFILCHV